MFYITHKIIRHPNTHYIIYILHYEYPDVHQSPYMELFNLMICIYILVVYISMSTAHQDIRFKITKTIN